MIRRIVNGIVLVALLAVAGLVIHTTPSDAERDTPIFVTGALGDPVTGRNIATTVDRVRLGDTVSTSSWRGDTEGVWVVADVSAQAVETETGALLNAWLVIGNETFSASERPGLATIADQALYAGIPIGGPVMFEVSAAAAASDSARTAKLQFAQNGDPRADSVIEVTVDLTKLEKTTSIETDATTWGDR